MKLILHNISKSFGTLTVLDHLSLTLESGQIYCLMGPSGAGKTTLLKLLMGLEKADGGRILAMPDDGVDSMRISVVFQEDRLCESFTPVENVMMVTGNRLPRADVRQELCRILPEESLDRPVSTLSGGMKRRTAICRALLAPFDLLLMDEPFTGLDDDTRQLVIRYVREKSAGKLVLLTTHQIQDVEALHAILLQLKV